jgi:hypothetical protein
VVSGENGLLTYHGLRGKVKELRWSVIHASA